MPTGLRLLATEPEAYDRQMAALQQYWSQDSDDAARLAERCRWSAITRTCSVP